MQKQGGGWRIVEVVLIAALGGILVEIQDTMEDGIGVGKGIFFAINALALVTAFLAKKPKSGPAALPE